MAQNGADPLGELFIIGFLGSEIKPNALLRENLRTGRPGGFILFNRSLSRPETGGNIRSPEQLKSLTKCLQRLRPSPPLICVDQEGGHVQRLNSQNGFLDICAAQEMGAFATLAMVESEARKNAQMLYNSGINVNFAPVVDLNLNSTNPIIGKVKRSFAADPERVTSCARAWVKTHRQHKIISCLKHFPGHGSSTHDSHLGFVDISKSWREIELIPYQQLISEKQVDMIMIGHLFNEYFDDEYPATLSYKTLTGVLRKQLGFDGVIVTDDLQMRAITDHYGFDEAICKALAAGADMIILGNNLDYRPNILQEAITAVKNGIDSGLVAEQTIVAALKRIGVLQKTIGKIR